MFKIDFQKAVEKLNGMISKRFDVNVQFVSSQSRQPQEVVYFETVRRNAGAPLIVTHNNMLIPLRVEGRLVGAFRVSDIQQLQATDISRIKETIDLTMEESFVAKTFSEASELEEFESNVLQLRKLSSDKLATAN